jgi:uncharacterized protein YndB with AHSA1/START domain
MRKEVTQKFPSGSDAAVLEKTGKIWSEWFTILDAAGAKNMNHTEITRYLNKEFGVPGWRSQMIANTYEQVRGMREKHQRPEGYEISVTKTIAVSNSAVYEAWQDEKNRSRWLPDSSIVIRKATESKSMRITWVDSKTSVYVNFFPKGNAKSQIIVQHGKLPDAKAAERMKAYWAKTLDRDLGSLGIQLHTVLTSHSSC